MLAAWFGKRAGLALARLLPYVLALVLLVGGGWLFYQKAYDRGVQDTEIKYKTLIDQERHRQIEANNEALLSALERQRELEKLLDDQEATIQELLEEAGNDPNASRPAIGADSVRRLNRIR